MSDTAMQKLDDGHETATNPTEGLTGMGGAAMADQLSPFHSKAVPPAPTSSPMAMHDVVDEHEIAVNLGSPDVVLGFGSWTHVEPFHSSKSKGPAALPPTAMQKSTETQATAVNMGGPDGPGGNVWLHPVPFHISAKIVLNPAPPSGPTAIQSVVAAQETLLRFAPLFVEGSGGFWICQTPEGELACWRSECPSAIWGWARAIVSTVKPSTAANPAVFVTARFIPRAPVVWDDPIVVACVRPKDLRQ